MMYLTRNKRREFRRHDAKVCGMRVYKAVGADLNARSSAWLVTGPNVSHALFGNGA